MEIREVKISRILNPTSIDLGEYVINPFLGCELGCLYCYVRSNRVVSRKDKPWGDYVDIRINAPEQLEKELKKKKPKTVLLGSTTECFQPLEKKCQLTRRLLEILNYHKVFYVILTRSPYILDYIHLLKGGFCKKIYFTVNDFSPGFKHVLEPRSAGFEYRAEAVNALLSEGLPVIPYFSPVLPEISNLEGTFKKFDKSESIEFECLNFNLKNISDIIDAIISIEPSLETFYKKMRVDPEFYSKAWGKIKNEIDAQAKGAKRKYNIYVHDFGGYFKNKYGEGQIEKKR